MVSGDRKVVVVSFQGSERVLNGRPEEFPSGFQSVGINAPKRFPWKIKVLESMRRNVFLGRSRCWSQCAETFPLENQGVGINAPKRFPWKIKVLESMRQNGSFGKSKCWNQCAETVPSENQSVGINAPKRRKVSREARSTSLARSALVLARGALVSRPLPPPCAPAARQDSDACGV